MKDRVLTAEEQALRTNDLYEWMRLRGHDYSILAGALINEGKGLVFDHTDGEFYIAARRKAPLALVMEYQPYIRWKYSKIVPEVKEIEVEEEHETKSGNKSIKKVKKEVPTGQLIDENPFSTQAYVAKKKQVLAELYSEKSSASPKEIKQVLATIIPRLVDHEKIQAIDSQRRQRNEEMLLHRISRTL